jgi:Mrp family chromosome partitioning ATPase
MTGSAWFDIIALATSKGGVGKSTLGRSLAAHWLGLGRKPALIDADPTGTLAKRYNPQGPLGAVPVIAARHAEFRRLAEEGRAERLAMGRLRRRATIARKAIVQILETRRQRISRKRRRAPSPSLAPGFILDNRFDRE